MSMDLRVSNGVHSARQLYGFLGSVGITIIAFGLFFLSPSPSYAQSTGTTTTGFVLTGCMERLFKITAYYTPESTQGVFFHGDYETERKINGGNRYGASGKHVYNGMLAGPKKYPFTTTVSLPGYGFGAIYDRGSAIIATGDYDRLDIRAGAGLQGMVNALRRGTKSVTGTVCSGGLDASMHGFDRTSYPLWEKASRQMIRTLDMKQGNSGLTVYYINSFLEQLGYLKFLESAPTSRDEMNNPDHKSFRMIHNQKHQFTTGTKLALCAFQQDKLGLAADNEYCGYYGTNTRRVLASTLKNGAITIPQIIESGKDKLESIVKKIKRKKTLRFR